MKDQMIRKKFISFSNWVIRNQRIICLVIISLAILRFFQLNYVNWDSGKLCTGEGGIQYAYDSGRLMSGADKLLNGEPLRRIQLPYIGYISIIALFYKLQIGLEYLLILQLLFALLAAYTLFDLCRTITGSRMAGIIAASLILINPFIVQWHLFIHTDSIYSSLLIISLWLIFKAFTLKTFKYYLLSVITSIFTITLRPHGWLIIPVIAVFITINTHIKKVFKIIILLCPLVMLFIALNIPSFIKLLDEYQVFSFNRHRVIIFENPNFDTKNPAEKDSLHIKGSSIYLFDHDYTGPFTAIKRISAELFPIYRTWVSFKFILRFLIWMLPLYLFSFLGLFYLFRNKGFMFVAVVLFFHLFLTGITYADKEFRFLVQILPLFTLLGICGLYTVWMKLYNNFLCQKK